MNRNIKHNIILIGFMGSGKTSVGDQLAKLLNYRFCDTDQMIEKRAADTINHIFSEHGEEYFRNLETNLVRELVSTLDHSVLSTGGGLPVREQNAKLLKDLGYVVFLKASKQTTIKRLQGDITRPLLQGDELSKKIDRMLEIRTPIYEKAAHKIVATDERSVQEIAQVIMESYMGLIY